MLTLDEVPRSPAESRHLRFSPCRPAISWLRLARPEAPPPGVRRRSRARRRTRPACSGWWSRRSCMDSRSRPARWNRSSRSPRSPAFLPGAQPTGTSGPNAAGAPRTCRACPGHGPGQATDRHRPARYLRCTWRRPHVDLPCDRAQASAAITQPPAPPAGARPPHRRPFPAADWAPGRPWRPHLRIQGGCVEALVKDDGRVLAPHRPRGACSRHTLRRADSRFVPARGLAGGLV
jgi:hypothetical protein